MAQELEHQHSADDIIIKDQDGTYKILKEGKFVSLDEVESEEALKAHDKERGPKRAPDMKKKEVPQFARKSEQALEKKEQPPQTPPQGSEKSDTFTRAEEVIKKSGVTFASSEIRQRVIQALIAHLKKIRKPFETRQQLQKPVTEGGAGLESVDLERIMSAVDGKETSLRPEIDISRTKAPQNDIVPPLSPLAVGKELHKPSPTKAKGQSLPPLPRPASPVKQAQVPRPNIVDIQKPARAAVGLAGQLNYALSDWRRIASNPQDRSKKIESQLDVLEEEGLPERLRGRESWRNSEVIRLYKEAGMKSLEQGKPLSEILQGGSPDHLSWDEWQAIARLNELLQL